MPITSLSTGIVNYKYLWIINQGITEMGNVSSMCVCVWPIDSQLRSWDKILALPVSLGCFIRAE